MKMVAGLALMSAVVGLWQQPLSFEAATVKPVKDIQSRHISGGSCRGIDSKYPAAANNLPALGRCTFVMTSLSTLLTIANAMPSAGLVQVTGGPSWLTSDFWDVEGKAEDPSTATEAQLKQMLQGFLRDRFQLQ